MNSAIGKIILFGEHSVVYGQPAIAIPFTSVSSKVKIKKSKENIVKSRLYNGRLEDAQSLRGFRTLLEFFYEEHRLQGGIEIDIRSNIPAFRGMGSSASIAIALSKALFDYNDLRYSLGDLIDLATVSEKVVHNNPSGIDVNVIARNKPIFFVKDKKVQEFNMKLEGFLLVADSGIETQTSVVVDGLRKNLERDKSLKKLIVDLGDIARRAKHEIEEGNISELGPLLTLNHRILCELGISHKKLDQFVEIALKNGAIGSKLTGKGQGGCMLALAPSYEIASRIAEKLKDAGAKNTWIMDLGGSSEKGSCKGSFQYSFN